MKRSKLLLVLAILVVLSMVFAACDDSIKHEDNDHVWSGWTITSAPTESAAGSATRKCICGKTDTATVPALSDSSVWTATVTPATHASEGVTIYTSTTWGTYSAKIAKLDAHTYGAWSVVTAPTADAAGSAKRVCSVDNHEDVMDLPAFSSDAAYTISAQVDPSHTAAGLKVYTHTTTGLSFNQTVAQGEHAFGNWSISVQPTLSAQGAAIRTCACGVAETSVVPALGEWGTPAHVDATCQSVGSDTYTHAVYGSVVVTIAKTAHTPGDGVVASMPTCTEDGVVNYTCSVCDEPLANGVLAALGHSWSTNYVAIVEGDTEWDGTTSDGEDLGDDDSGYHALYCTVCHVYDEDNKASHNPVDVGDVYVDSYYGFVEIAQQCSDCGVALEERSIGTGTLASSWTLVSSTPATHNNPGVAEYKYNSENENIANITIRTDKLVAPYDGKTYSSIQIDGGDESASTSELYARAATLTMGNDTTGTGSGYPFGGTTTITMVDAATGKLAITNGSNNYIGYVDMATGIIVRQRIAPTSNLYADVDVLLLSPYHDEIPEAAVKASYWGNNVAITYSYPCAMGANHSVNVFVTKVVGGDWTAHFGVEFTDINGNAISADAAYNASYVNISKAGEKIAAFAKDSTGSLAVTDGLEGTYAITQDSNTYTVVANGIGGATIDGAISATYNAVEGEDYIEVRFNNGTTDVYARVTLDVAAKTGTMVVPTATVTYDVNAAASNGTVTPDAIEAAVRNITIEYALPTLTTTSDYVFLGWTVQGDETNTIHTKYAPTTDVTLVAVWAGPISVTVVNRNNDGAVEENYKLPVGKTYGEYFAAVEDTDTHLFAGWYISEDGTLNVDEDIALEGDVTISLTDAGLYIIAKWDELPAYVGEYIGAEYWGASFGGTSLKTLTIDKNGNISGMKTGIVVSYDETTQVVEWKTSATSSTTSKFYFDKNSGVIAGIYGGNDIGNDYYLFSKHASALSEMKAIGLYAEKEPGSSTRNYYVQIVTVPVKASDEDVATTKMILLYNNHIYSNATFATTAGEVLTSHAEILAAKTLVITDNTTNTVVIRLAAGAATFGDGQSNTVSLDSYYGTYTTDGESITLDGVGGFVWGTKVGTYQFVTDHFELFVVEDEKNVEYYTMTISGTTATLTKPMTTITFVTGDGHPTQEDVSVNRNIEYTLPVLTDDAYLLRGWLTTEDGTDGVYAITPGVSEQAITLYANWKLTYTITLVLNDGATDTANPIVLGAGETVEIAKPTKEGKKFGGWFTTATFDEGTEWDFVGQAISGDDVEITIYAKWEEAPVYTDEYYVQVIKPKSAEASIHNNNDYSGSLVIDEEGNLKSATFWPFLGFKSGSVTSFDSTTGAIALYATKSNGTVDLVGYRDQATGIILFDEYDAGEKWSARVYLLSPYETAGFSSKIKSSYWANGTYRVISYTYTDAESVEHAFNVYISNNQVYFNVTLTDISGNVVAGDACYNAATLFVKDSTGAIVAQWGYDGSTMVALDGYQGTYTCEGKEAVVLDGVEKFTMGTITGKYAPATEGSAHTFDVYAVDGTTNVYYKLTVNKDNKTYTIEMPTAVINFTSSAMAMDAVNASINCVYVLPVPTHDTLLFRGWYAQGDDTQTIVTEVTPLEGQTYNYVAIWVNKVTVTMVINSETTQTKGFGVGDIVALDNPDAPAGQAFGGWFTDAEFTTAYTGVGVAITENITIYAQFVELPYTITQGSTYYFVQDADGAWVSNNQGVGNSNAEMVITATKACKITIKYYCSGEKGYDYFSINTGNGATGSAVQKFGSEAGTSGETTFTLEAGGTLTVIYQKDNGVNKGEDSAKILSIVAEII